VAGSSNGIKENIVFILESYRNKNERLQ
jgi:hypothetical protein